ncbi:hypothetical protein E2C01_004023 [Portunus trituberculatus]|uniref:Uncharacterized protein n=1 Tax=Portunus trituberculatus TaxID=210409 RepID=A0A5B7CRB2_PORTR|nr:hypothetical protein [Portunus trituberculatus]
MHTEGECDGGVFEGCRGWLARRPTGTNTPRQRGVYNPPSAPTVISARKEVDYFLLIFSDVVSRYRQARSLNDDNTRNSNHKIQ